MNTLDSENYTTDAFKAWSAARSHYSEGQQTTVQIQDGWRTLEPRQREGWHKVAQTISEPLMKRLGSQITTLSEALREQTEGHPIVTLDYTNHTGVRGLRHVKPLSVLYGVTDWHSTPGLLMPCWDLDRGALRVYSLEREHLHAWNHTPVEMRGDPKRVIELEAENLAVRQELAAMSGRYASAVHGRAAFREAFREMREAIQRVETNYLVTLAMPAKEQLADRAFTTEEICRSLAVPVAEPEKPAAGDGPRSEMFARLAASQWYAHLGFTGFDWNGLTDTQRDAWRAVVAYLVPRPRIPFADEVAGTARLNRIREELNAQINSPMPAALSDEDVEFLFAGAAIALATQVEGGATADWRMALTVAGDRLEAYTNALHDGHNAKAMLSDVVKAMRGVPAPVAASEPAVKPERSREEWRDRVTALNRDLVLLLHRSHTRATFVTAAGEWNGVIGGFTDLPCGDTEFRVLIGTGLTQKVQLLRVKDLREVGFA